MTMKQYKSRKTVPYIILNDKGKGQNFTCTQITAL